MAGKICPRCGSSNISYQVVQTSSVSKTKGSTTVKVRGSKGCLYWITIGWIIGLFKLMVKILYMVTIGWILALFPHRGHKVEVAEHTATTTTKTKNTTKAVCQDCGHTWNA